MPPLHTPVEAFLAGFVVGRASAELDLRHWRNAYREAACQAEHDPLTGLPNRDAAHRYYSRHLGEPWAVLLIDLDDFTTVTDRHGHAAGDAMLVEIADRLHHAARSCRSRAFRLAGAEFLVQLPVDGAVDDALDTICSAAIDLLPDTFASYTSHGIQHLSFGYARTDRLNWAQALRHADIALYHAKAYGYFITYQRGMCHPTAPTDRRGTRLRNLPTTGHAHDLFGDQE